LIKFFVIELIEGFAEEFKDGLILSFFHFLLDEETEFFNSFFGVFLHEVLHVELENVLVLARLFLDDLVGQLWDLGAGSF
jgi:hypothetical protein